MKNSPKLIQALLLLWICLTAISSLEASMLKFEKNIDWASFRDLTSTEFSAKFKVYKNKYMLIVLWKRVNSSFVRGIGWRVPTIGGKKVAEHGGSFEGTRTFMRVYRNDGLVIAVMTNRRNQSSGSLESLTSNLANIVL